MSAIVWLGGFAASGLAQEPVFDIRLPNPDGRDPAFDRSAAGQAIAIDFSRLSGAESISLDDFAGSLRLINFWATWCAPCIKELPSLAALARRRSEAAFRVIPISLDQKDASRVPAFISELNVQGLEWFADPTALSGQAAGVFVLPTTVIVNPAGRELGRIVGSADWESAEAVALIDALLDQAER